MFLCRDCWDCFSGRFLCNLLFGCFSVELTGLRVILFCLGGSHLIPFAVCITLLLNVCF